MPTRVTPLLNVRDLDRSAAFYLDIGFTVKRIARDEAGNPYLTTVVLEDAEVHLSSIAANPDEDFLKWVEGGLGGGIVIGFDVPDVDAMYMKVTGSTSAHVETPIQDSPFGRVFTVHDPDGYVLMFITERAGGAQD